MAIPINTSTFKPAPAGVALGRCVRIIDLGTQTGEYQGRQKVMRKIAFGFELPRVLIEDGDHKGEPHLIYSFFGASLHEKSNLRPFLVNWTNAAMATKEQQQAVMASLPRLVGRFAQLNIVHSDQGKARIGSIMGCTETKESLKALGPAFNKPIYLELVQGTFKKSDYDLLSDGIKDMIRASPEGRMLIAPDPVHDAAHEDSFDGGGEPSPFDNDPLA